MTIAQLYVFCVDVGSPANVGWADCDGVTGSAQDLGDALRGLGERLRLDKPVALGFEAPIWTPSGENLTLGTRRQQPLWGEKRSGGFRLTVPGKLPCT